MRIIEVRVRSDSRTSRVCESVDGSWRAQLKSPPVDGRANTELIARVARYFGLKRSQVELRSGASGRIKRLRLDLP